MENVVLLRIHLSFPQCVTVIYTKVWYHELLLYDNELTTLKKNLPIYNILVEILYLNSLGGGAII